MCTLPLQVLPHQTLPQQVVRELRAKGSHKTFPRRSFDLHVHIIKVIRVRTGFKLGLWAEWPPKTDVFTKKVGIERTSRSGPEGQLPRTLLKFAIQLDIKKQRVKKSCSRRA